MKIVGGNFGVKGYVSIVRNKKLIIDSTQSTTYLPEQIQSISANTTKERKFGIFGFLIGAILLSLILGALLNFLGVILGIIIAAAGSFYSNSIHTVEIKFTDNKLVQLECTPRGVKRLIQFAPV